MSSVKNKKLYKMGRILIEPVFKVQEPGSGGTRL